ncbi:hypothetical protein M422DRAFT_271859 [Sphaerobolus stellatus SS14]|uniref:Uncharacterized protein n=1 Tax=Sphaerobolus stellatus (strain SS14) TaxID=990650 RepID=A0A0C9UCW8_SPHS4|nr:hypothetical protein M422DRAFT_271859 [Sphaerobolus stellatus SS14]
MEANDDEEHSDDGSGTLGGPSQDNRKRSSREEPRVDVSLLRMMVLARAVSSREQVRVNKFQFLILDSAYMNAECTFQGPAQRRGPPKGYLNVMETRLHEAEALLGAIISIPKASLLISALCKDPLADKIITRDGRVQNRTPLPAEEDVDGQIRSVYGWRQRTWCIPEKAARLCSRVRLIRGKITFPDSWNKMIHCRRPP